MDTAWGAYVEFDAPTLPDDAHDQVMDLLAAYYPAISSPEGVFGVYLTIEAPTAERAITEALRVTRDALNTAYGARPIKAFELLTEQERERRTMAPDLPELAGRAEVADILGVKPQRASQIMQTDRFRSAVGAVQQLATGPVVAADAVRRYAETRASTPGRPRKDPDAAA